MTALYKLVACLALTACGSAESGSTNPVPEPAALPASRWLGTMVYDGAHSQLLLFGGDNGVTSAVPAFYGDLWVWTGSQWSKIATTTGPSARDGAVLAYDANRQRVVLFGGRAASGSTTVQLNDTWEWNGTNWTQISVNGPPARAHMAGGYDVQRKRVVVHGGTNPDGSPLSDTWEYDGAAWTRQSTAAPNGYTLPSNLVFDATKNALLMIAGDISTGKSQLWQWSGTAWSNIGDAPTVDLPASLVSLGASNLLLADVGSSTPQTYRWNGASWSALSTTMPMRRFGAAIGYDPGRQQVVLFGGLSSASAVLNETWVWNGTTWSRAQ